MNRYLTYRIEVPQSDEMKGSIHKVQRGLDAKQWLPLFDPFIVM